jgi:hypothetical protein
MALKNRQGSFLVEAMLAVVIVGCALIVLMRAYMAAVSTARVQEGYTKAILLLSDELDAVVLKGFIDRGVHRTYQKVMGGEAFAIHVETKPVAGRNINEVIINVGWPAAAPDQRMISAVTYLLSAQEEEAANAQK